MDIRAAHENLRWSRTHGAGVSDFIKSFYWSYSGSLPGLLRKDHLSLDLSYPGPIGKLKLRVRTNRADRFIFGEIFDHQYYRLDYEVAPATILDVGANAGFATIYFSRLFPSAEIACLEPEPGNVSILRENLRLNAVPATVFPAALAIKDGIEKLFIHDRDYGHSLAPESRVTAPATIEVPVMTAQTVIDRLGWSRIGLLKVDIEGYEKRLFAADSDWLRIVDNMMIEWHDDLDNSRCALEEIAVRHGFAPPRLLPGIWWLTRPARASH